MTQSGEFELFTTINCLIIFSPDGPCVPNSVRVPRGKNKTLMLIVLSPHTFSPSYCSRPRIADFVKILISYFRTWILCRTQRRGSLGQTCHSRSKLGKQMSKDDIFLVNDNYWASLIWFSCCVVFPQQFNDLSIKVKLGVN